MVFLSTVHVQCCGSACLALCNVQYRSKCVRLRLVTFWCRKWIITLCHIWRHSQAYVGFDKEANYSSKQQKVPYRKDIYVSPLLFHWSRSGPPHFFSRIATEHINYGRVSTLLEKKFSIHFQYMINTIITGSSFAAGCLMKFLAWFCSHLFAMI